LRELPDVAQVVEELDHPEGAANLVPAERRRRDLLRQVPGEVERVDAVEHPEVVGLAPHDLLAPAADGERNPPELDVGVELAQLVLELEGVERVGPQGPEIQVGNGEQLVRLAGLRRRDADLGGVLEVVQAAVVPAVDVLLLEEARGGVVDAVVDAAPEQGERRLLDEGDVVLADPRAALEPVVVEADVGGVAVLDVLPGGGVGGAEEVLGLGVAGDLQRPEPERGAGVPRESAPSTGNETREEDQPQATVRHASGRGSCACSVRDEPTTCMVASGRMVRSGESSTDRPARAATRGPCTRST